MKKLIKSILVLLVIFIFTFLGLTFIFSELPSGMDEVGYYVIRIVGMWWLCFALWATYKYNSIIKTLII